MRSVLTSLIANPHYKLLSLLMALTTWLYVQGEQVVESKIRVPVAWALPKGLVTVEPLPAAVMVTVSGSRAAVRRSKDNDLELQIDLTDATMGETGLEFASFPPVVPQSLEIVGFSPSAIRFVLDERWTQKAPVEASWVGEPGAGYDVAAVTLEPEVVTLVGPRATVALLREVQTKPIDVSGLTADARVPVELDLPRSVRVEGEVEPTAFIDLEPLVERASLSDIPVYSEDAWTTDGARVTVTLEGPAAIMRDLDPGSVVVKVLLPNDPARARYEAAFGPQTGLRLAVVHPRDLRVVEVQPPMVEVRRR